MADVQRWDCPADEYFASPAISRSRLEVFMESPADYIADVQRPESAALRWGRLVHLRVLEPGEFRRRVHVLAPVTFNRRTDAGKAEAAAHQGQLDAMIARGILPVTLDEASRLEAMTHALADHELARGLITRYEREVSYTWTDDATGLQCRARLDLHTTRGAGKVIDLKSTDDPSPAAFGRSAGKWGYHRQGAWYRRPIRELTGREPRVFFIAVRSEAPYEVAVYELHEDDIATADRQIDDALAHLSACITTNNWIAPWQAPTARYLEIPRWALQVNS